MKKIFGVIIALFICSSAFSQGIKFEHGTWAEVKAKAKTENKIIFVDVYTSWCGPCKVLAKTVFTDSNVGEYFNKNIISFKIDAEKGEGPEFAKTYEVKAFPTLLFINGDGELVLKAVGGKSIDEFIALAKSANDPKKQLPTLAKKYNSGDRDEQTVLSYIAALKESRGSYAEIIEEYLKELGENNWESQAVFEIVSKYMDDPKNMAFTYFVENKKAYEKYADRKDIDDAIFNVFKMNLIKRINSEGRKIVDELNETSKIVEEPLRTHITNYFTVVASPMDAYANKEFRAKVDSHIQNYATAWEINNYIDFMLYQKKNEDIPEELKLAEKWCLKGIELEDNVKWRTKYITILLKQGKKEEAEKLVVEEFSKSQKDINKSTNKVNALYESARALVNGELFTIPMAAKKSEEWIRQALKIEDNLNNNSVLVSALSAQGRHQEVTKIITKIEKLDLTEHEKAYVQQVKAYNESMLKTVE